MGCDLCQISQAKKAFTTFLCVGTQHDGTTCIHNTWGGYNMSAQHENTTWGHMGHNLRAQHEGTTWGYNMRVQHEGTTWRQHEDTTCMNNMREQLEYTTCGHNIASFAGLPRFLFFTRKWKSAKNGEVLGTPTTWLTSGGRKVDVGGRGQHSNTWNNVLDFIIERSTARQDPRRSQDHEYSTWPVSSQVHCARTCNWAPPPLRPPCVHLTSFTWLVFHVFRALPLPCIILKAGGHNMRAQGHNVHTRHEGIMWMHHLRVTTCTIRYHKSFIYKHIPSANKSTCTPLVCLASLKAFSLITSKIVVDCLVSKYSTWTTKQLLQGSAKVI